MAEDVTVLDRPSAAESQPSRRERARRASYRYRFAIAYVLLAAVVGAGVGAFVVLATRPSPAEPEPWSAWQPTGSRTAMMRQIADRIPKAYKEDGAQLTVSTAGGLSVTTEQGELPVRSVFVRPDTSRGLAEEEDIDVYEGDRVVSYALCGASDNEQCAITTGTPSAARFTLLRREALELSLYTLKYVEDTESVIVFMPPTPKGESNGTVFLTRDDLANELRRPLSAILPSRTPTVDSLSEVEEGHVLRLTEPRTYAFQFQASPDGSPILVLSPPSAAES